MLRSGQCLEGLRKEQTEKRANIIVEAVSRAQAVK